MVTKEMGLLEFTDEVDFLLHINETDKPTDFLRKLLPEKLVKKGHNCGSRLEHFRALLRPQVKKKNSELLSERLRSEVYMGMHRVFASPSETEGALCLLMKIERAHPTTRRCP